MQNSLAGQIALVTGASRGVGRGIAAALRDAGATVYATGRSIASANLDPSIVRLRCDHTDDAAVRSVFEHIAADHERLHLLVNNAWGGYEQMVDASGRFTWMLPFWEQPAPRWDLMMNAGVRAAYVASQHAARMMVPERRGLIVNISFWAAQKHLGNVVYGIAKAATDKLTFDSAHELRPHNVTVVSLYPGLVKTEAVVAAGVFDLSRAESPEFLGRAIAALAADPDVARRTGTIVVAAALAREYGFTDIDGRLPPALSLSDL
ncbi:MAG TPA: SDR family NAD(P)-dependent oxidoreductase [Vicinamibacterales bacterium]|nr:SDR family NAD(P)-dependent oxidoreductase [Vicinamibacterales bacterium]